MRYGRIEYLDTQVQANYEWQAIRGVSRVVHVYDGPKMTRARAGLADIKFHRGNGGYIWSDDG